MKKEYDFASAEKGKFYHPVAELEMPIYLHGKTKEVLAKIALEKNLNVSDIVNAILDSEVRIHLSYFDKPVLKQRAN